MEGKTAKEKKSFKDDYMRLRHAIDKVLSHTMVSLENQVSLSRGGEQQGRLYSLIKITIHGYDPSQQRGQSILTKVGHKASLTVRFKLIWSHWVASVLMARAFIDRNCRQAIVIQVFYWFVNWQKMERHHRATHSRHLENLRLSIQNQLWRSTMLVSSANGLQWRSSTCGDSGAFKSRRCLACSGCMTSMTLGFDSECKESRAFCT